MYGDKEVFFKQQACTEARTKADKPSCPCKGFQTGNSPSRKDDGQWTAKTQEAQ